MRHTRRLIVMICVAVWVTAVGHTNGATRSFLWKATGQQGAIYLVGSVHMLTEDYYPLSPALEAAYKDADLLVEEADFGDMLSPSSQFLMLRRSMLPSQQSLDTVVSPATVALVNTRVGNLGLPIEPLKRFKPWALALMLIGLEWQKAGFASDLGLDRHFYDRAQADGKAVQALETFEYQISRFDEMPMDQQDRLLTATLKDLDTEKANVNTLVRAWKNGDVPAVDRIVLQDLQQDPEMYQRLLVERNRNWLPKLEMLFARRGRAFVVVGAAHLVGADGLLAMLKSKRYSIEQQ